ncbi:hypothetical protein SOPP22_01710 [Shewanella sp. OPT22]|nr:hypothetical protein SOPP22_01710 [Shewanella sp. OPT22]
MKTWMQRISDTKKLTDMFIPGTHDSATSGVDIPFVTTQSKNILEQLESGIRFLDIRINKVKIGTTEGLVLVHGKVPLLKEFWRDAFDPIHEFLHHYPTEFVVVSIKEGDLTDTAQISESDLNTILSNGIFVSSQIELDKLTVEDCRGKILFINRINGEGYSWGDKKVNLSDDYSLPTRFREQVIVPGVKERTQRVCVPVSDKDWKHPWRTHTECKEVVIVPGVKERTQRVPGFVDYPWKTEKVNEFLSSKRKSGLLNICFLSATNAGGSADEIASMLFEPNGVSNNATIQNEWFCENVHNFANDALGGCILPMDYPSQKVIDSIISLNS